MKKFIVTGDVSFAFVMEVEAENEDAAAEAVEAMSPDDLAYSKEAGAVLIDVQDIYEGETTP
jgi:hypothetical protein